MFLGISPLHTAFRGMHQQVMPREGHELLHRTFEPPAIPNLGFVIYQVEQTGMYIPRRLKKEIYGQRSNIRTIDN
jgi:hypothetical protein